MARYLLALLVALLFEQASLGAAQSSSCEGEISSLDALFECAERLSPEVRTATLELEQAKLQLKANVQWRNPEFSVNSFSGSIAGSRQSETDLVLGVPIELGGKISARRELSNASVKQAEAALFMARSAVRKALLSGFNRVRQLNHELSVVDESLKTFGTLVKQFGSRSRLSPEQETSAAVYRLAQSQYALKRVDLVNEVSQLNTFFLVNTGRSADEMKTLIPGSPPKWPAKPPGQGPVSSPRVLAANASFSLAEANLAVARSESWPTITVGPSFRIQNQSGVSGNLLGFNFGLPLPIFNANGAGRAAAEAGLLVSETTRDLTARGDNLLKKQQLEVYRTSLEALSSTLSHQQVEKAHADVERLFLRGVVPSSLVIEAHRSYLDLELGRNEREQKALDALLNLYEIEGTIFEVKL